MAPLYVLLEHFVVVNLVLEYFVLQYFVLMLVVPFFFLFLDIVLLMVILIVGVIINVALCALIGSGRLRPDPPVLLPPPQAEREGEGK